MRAIDRALRAAEYRDRFEIEQQWAVRIGDLHEALLRYQPDIIHFSGHGTASSEIVLQNESGTGQVVPHDALGRLFSVLRDNIRCVVLNACYSEQQADAIANHIDCVVGMTSAVGDDAAIQFATAFYRALGFGRDVQTAFDLGANLIGLQGLPDEETPHLVAKRGNAKDVSFVAPSTPAPPPLREAVPSKAIRPGLAHIVGALVERVRYLSDATDRDRTPTGPAGGEPPGTPLESRFRRTDEVFVDPTSGQRTRVWIDPSSGERRYVSENQIP